MIPLFWFKSCQVNIWHPSRTMGVVIDEASKLHECLMRFETTLAHKFSQGEYAKTYELVQSLTTCLEEEFDFIKREGSAAMSSYETVPGLKRRLRNAKRKIEESAAALDETLGNKVSGRIQHIWFVRVGLAKPTLSMRTLADFCRDYPAEETKHIGYVYVGATRDAICEVVKQINRSSIQHLVSQMPLGIREGETGPIFITHIHDEASMKIRSSARPLPGSALADEIRGAALSRSRHTKIQNNVVTVVGGEMAV